MKKGDLVEILVEQPVGVDDNHPSVLGEVGILWECDTPPGEPMIWSGELLGD